MQQVAGPVAPMSVRETPLPAAPTTPTTPSNQRLTPLLFVGLMLGLLLAELDQTMLSTALPSIVGELGGVDRMLWVTTAYVLAGTVVMPMYGKLGDLLGRKPLFIAALSVFVAGSVLGGLAPDITWLIVARAVQRLGGGGLLILIQAIIADIVPARERAASMSVVGAVFWWRHGAASPTAGDRPSSSRSAPSPYWPVRPSSPLNTGPPTRSSRWRCFGIGPSQRRRSPVW
jgi:hypothetical protein